MENNSGVSIVFQDSAVPINGIVAQNNSLSSVTLKKYASISFNGEHIGRTINMFYQESIKSIVCLFKITDEIMFDSIYDNQEKYIAIPQIKCRIITCPVCNNSYSAGQTPCACINIGNILIVKSFDIIGLKLFDTSCNMPELNEKRVILRDFFAGAIGNLKITEEI